VAEQLTLVKLERDMLRQQLEEARAREATLLRLLEQLSPTGDRQAAAPPLIPQQGHRLASAMRQQVLAVLQRHPRGLHRTQIQEEIGVEKDLSSVLYHMKRDGLLVHKGSGIYALAGLEATRQASKASRSAPRQSE
jgi:hypothetical protein